MNTLTSCERVNRALERRDHDRVPRAESFWGETITRWQGEGLQGDQNTVLEMLGTDFQQVGWTWPVAFPSGGKVLREDDETTDIWDGQGKSVRYWKHKSGTPAHLGFDCDTREKWEKIYKPALLQNWQQLNPAEVTTAFAEGRRRGRWCHLTGVEPFEETRSLMGDEITLMALAEDPDWVADVSRTFTDVIIRNYETVLATGIQPDGLWTYGDMAFKTATMCSPAMYRELIWPDHKRLADWAHAHGMKFIYHTDGNVNGVLDLYLEAGFDCLHPLESKANMDIRKLGPIYGNRLSFFGNIDVMVMMTNDLAKIEAEIATKFAAGKLTKGYIYHSDHSVPPQVSWETYQQIMRWVEQYGHY